jgi:hypothetical protein
VRKPEYHTFVFYIVLHILTPEEKRTKLELSNLKGFFVGCRESSKAYKVYISSQWKIVVSRDVTFNEDACSSKSQEPPIEVEEGETLAIPNVDPKRFQNQISKVLKMQSMLHYLLVQPGSLGGLPIHCKMQRNKLELQRHSFK